MNWETLLCLQNNSLLCSPIPSLLAPPISVELDPSPTSIFRNSRLPIPPIWNLRFLNSSLTYYSSLRCLLISLNFFFCNSWAICDLLGVLKSCTFQNSFTSITTSPDLLQLLSISPINPTHNTRVFHFHIGVLEW